MARLCLADRTARYKVYNAPTCGIELALRLSPTDNLVCKVCPPLCLHQQVFELLAQLICRHIWWLGPVFQNPSRAFSKPLQPSRRS